MTSIDASVSTPSGDLAAHLRAAMVALRTGDIETAVSEADKARSIDQSPQVLIVFAALAHSIGRDVDALEMLDHAAKLAPSVGNYPDASAAILLKLGRKADGIFNLKLGTHLPQDDFVSELIGNYFGSVKDIFDSFIENRPLRTAELMMSQNMYMSAFRQLEVYIGVSGGDSLAFALIAECALRLGKQMDAQVALNALRVLDSNYSTLLDMELQLAVLQGEPEKIKTQFAALKPPSSLLDAVGRLGTMVTSPYFDDAAVEAVKNSILGFIKPVEGLSAPVFELESETLTVGFICEIIDPALEGVITALKDKVSIRVYILGSMTPPSQQRLKAGIEDWREVQSVDDLTLAEMVRMDGISILFDCSALSKFSRPSVLRSRIAPIQVLWYREDSYDDPLSYDYYLASPYQEIDSNDERALKLSSPLVYPIPSLEAMGRITDLRVKRAARKPEEEDQVRLLAPHTAAIVSDALLQCWMDILTEVPSATLALIASPDMNDPYVQRVVAAANEKSVAARIDLIAPDDFSASLYDILLEADVILDSFPRGNKDAIWGSLLIGCPSLSLAGDKPYTSVSSLLLWSGGQFDAIATDEADYKAKAIALASDAALRERFAVDLRKMHKDMTFSSYQNTATELSEKLDALWRNWCMINA